MALIHCPKCGKEVSNQAPACIYCGYPLKEFQDIQKEKKIPQEEQPTSHSVIDSGRDLWDPQHSQADVSISNKGKRTARPKKEMDKNGMKKFFLGLVVGIIVGIAITVIWAFLYDGNSNTATNTVDNSTQVQEQVSQVPEEYISILNEYVEEAYYSPETFRLCGDIYVLTGSESEVIVIGVTSEVANGFGDYTRDVTNVYFDGSTTDLAWVTEGEESFTNLEQFYNNISNMSPQEKEDALYSDELGKVDAEKYDGRDVAELMGVEYIES